MSAQDQYLAAIRARFTDPSSEMRAYLMFNANAQELKGKTDDESFQSWASAIADAQRAWDALSDDERITCIAIAKGLSS